LKRLLSVVLLLLLLLALLPLQAPTHAQGTARVDVKSTYTLDRFGFATINESVTFTNNGTSTVQVPSLVFGFGNISTLIVSFNLTGSGFTGSPQGGALAYTVSGSSLAAQSNSSYVLSALVNGVSSTLVNGSLAVLTLSSPSINVMVDRLVNLIQMPPSTTFSSLPPGLAVKLSGTNDTYSSIEHNVSPQAAVTSLRAVAQSGAQVFNPLRIYYAVRTISASAGGTPQVTEQLKFQNMGTVPLAKLYVSMLAPGTTPVTIVTVTPSEPVLLNPFPLSVADGYINLAYFVVGYPSSGVPAGANFTLTYRYPLGGSYYSVSGGQVTMDVPETPPVKAFIDTFTINMSLPQGATATKAQSVTLTGVTPWQRGATSFAYGLSLGWGINSGVPLASFVFVLLLVGLFAARTSTAEAEEGEEEEESSTELASGMITAFDEKTNLINGLWPEIASKDLNEVDKEYFDGLRSRLDQFRSRALQRLDEVKQKSTSQRFFEIVNQIQSTEREVDRAAKDKLNLYQQYYLRQMRKEVYDRLLPQYSKRLERALNQLSDELHTVQREAKLL
jgi:hypothetical protein